MIFQDTQKHISVFFMHVQVKKKRKKKRHFWEVLPSLLVIKSKILQNKFWQTGQSLACLQISIIPESEKQGKKKFGFELPLPHFSLGQYCLKHNHGILTGADTTLILSKSTYVYVNNIKNDRNYATARERESQGYPCWWHDKMMIYKRKYIF